MKTKKKSRPGMTTGQRRRVVDAARSLAGGAVVGAAAATVLDEAARLTAGERQADYGHPIEDHTRTATMWSALLGRPVTAEQVCLCMVALKLSRQCHKPKRDNLVDACGYLRNVEMIEERRLVAAEDGFKWYLDLVEDVDARRRCEAARAAAKKLGQHVLRFAVKSWKKARAAPKSAAGGKRVR